MEEDERGQLNSIRLKEEQTLSTYDYVDKNAGTVRIPIDRAMDLHRPTRPPRPRAIRHAEKPQRQSKPAPPQKKEAKK